MDEKKLKNKKNELLEFDKRYNKIVVGVDEAGRGPLAGPVVAGAVIVNQEGIAVTYPQIETIFQWHLYP